MWRIIHLKLFNAILQKTMLITQRVWKKIFYSPLHGRLSNHNISKGSAGNGKKITTKKIIFMSLHQNYAWTWVHVGKSTHLKPLFFSRTDSIDNLDIDIIIIDITYFYI